MKSNSKLLGMMLVGIMVVTLVPLVTSPTVQTSESPEDSGLIDIIWSDDGIWYPDNSITRYRKDDSATDKTFYQWWYWNVRDYTTSNNFAMCYYTLYSPSTPELTGAYILFSAVTNQGKVMIWYRFNEDQMHFLGNDFQFSIGENGEFQQIPIDNDHYTITGVMNQPDNVWTDDITYPGLSENSYFAWNINFNRLVGNFAHNDIVDNPLAGNMADSSIKWNTFSFDSLVTGSITMGSQVFNLNDNTRYRGYADSNWDQTFLAASDEPENPDKYRWSWASVNKIDPINPANDISIIAGYGITDNFFGLSVPTTGLYASGFNIPYTNGQKSNVCWKVVDTREALINVKIAEKCSWGSSADRFVNVDATAENYFIYTDSYGSARLPSKQVYTLEGEYTKITMDFTISASDVNRLPSAYPEYIWSNFEALGATAVVNIYAKTYKWYDPLHYFPTYTLVQQFTDTCAGVEYGYSIQDVSI